MDNDSVQHFDDWRAKLGREVRDCRKRLGWDQVTLAKKATPILYPAMDTKISTETISRVENGGNITTDMLNALAIALEVEIKIKLRPFDKPDPPSTNPSDVAQPHTPTPPSPEQVRALLSDIPPPGGGVTNGDVEATDPRSRLARIGAELIQVMEDLDEARGQAPVVGRRGPDQPARDRKNRGRANRRPVAKASSKRR